MWVGTIKVERDIGGVGNKAARLRVIYDGEGVWCPGRRVRRDIVMAEQWRDVWILDPLCMVGKALVIQRDAAMPSARKRKAIRNGLTASSKCWVTMPCLPHCLGCRRR